MQNTLIKDDIQNTYRDNLIDITSKVPKRQPIVFCDFDGTVTTTDVTDVLLEELALPQWKVIEEQWVNGKIDDCQCMSEQIALIQGDWKRITGVLDQIKIDPYFKDFVAQCRSHNVPLHIGSNGIDRVLKYILDREHIQVDGIWSYHLIESNNGWALKFPKDKERGICQIAHSIACKCTLLEPAKVSKITDKNAYKIVIGDSKSDFCWSNKADFVFAKKKLAQYCGARDIDYLSFDNFLDINSILANKGIFS